jgi:hypothetical protein
MQKLSVNDLDLIPGIVQRGELTPELARRGRELTPKHAQYLFDCARHEAAHVIAAFACPNGWASHVYINPAIRHRSTWRSASNATCGAPLLEHEAFISLAGAEMEAIMALERGVMSDEESRTASSHDLKRAKEECSQIGVEFYLIYRAIHRFLREAREAVNYMTVAILLMSTQSGELNPSKLKRIRQWIKKYIPHYGKYGPHPKKKCLT